MVQLDVPSLRTFIAVLDHGGMTRAAEALDLSQSAVSWKMKRLEERVGRPLLIREGHTLRPSQDGEELLEHARTIVALHDEAVARLTSSELTGRVRIGANDEISAGQLTDLLSRFDRVHPRARIEFHVEQSTMLARMLAKGDLDVAVFQVVEHDVRPTDRVLWRDELCWAASSQSPVSVDPVPLVTYGLECCYAPLAIADLDAVGRSHRLAFSGQSSASVEAAVTAGLGVAVLSRRQLSDDIVEWSPDFELPPLPEMCQVVRHTREPIPPIADALVSELVAEVTRPLPTG
jgi:DNA-binding transcriptional LysR family regulator